MKTIKIDPITRISGLLSITVKIEDNVIVDAICEGMQFRGFNTMLQGRAPLDAIRLTPRICGICSTHHTLASVTCLEEAMNVTADQNGIIMREIINGFEFLQNHLRQLYQFSFPDFVDISSVNLLHKRINPEAADYRLPPDINEQLCQDYVDAIKYSRLAHKALTTLGGKAPHVHSIYVGGVTTHLDAMMWESSKAILSQVKGFIETKLKPDCDIIAKYYPEYFNLGKSYENYLSYGLYHQVIPNQEYVSPSVMINGVKGEFNPDAIKMDLTYSRLRNEANAFMPLQDPATLDLKKEAAYSFVEATRYNGLPMEGGPLARMILSGKYPSQNSVLDRITARCLEAELMANYLTELLDVVTLSPAYQEAWVVPKTGRGKGLVDASRGPLGHYIEIEETKIKNYSIVTPSQWNLSPRDSKNQLGPAENALVGTRLVNPENPNTEIGRIIRSFDPCLNCAAHIISDRHAPVEIQII